ncbi:hypothetical protein G1K75_12570 [Tenacibaculum finnmarkense]|uniref:hypothetical protein n=1 Tax=Tenacibaculum finnmarkense TaxID=2781243 RepID=UPI00187B7046|nr:hypothetical protein [Tenacibaculum finnmarkense]MBE7698686.1 hypothetical protein [Tenacibaculum finnmarkense genomovar ulcerans]MCD8401304.1 hypothetical protein [Tenacibaculum finnmarkense genomovar ulcerans]MCD8411137.1 hypothetical protein [Tenacibaculum finnmarkense genomovar ulcerans]MCG8806485.1 hypothetical protein [Tenacibaculum finnmarkense]MCG8814040.1 hypothetical protein [Tenacibaculum finnmarkense]
MKMTGYHIIILGILLIGVGTFLTIYGQSMNSEKDSAKLTEQNIALQTKLSNLESTNSSLDLNLSELRIENKSLSEQYSDMINQNQGILGQSKEIIGQNTNLQDSNLKLSSKIEKYQKAIEEKEKEIELLKKRVDNKDPRIILKHNEVNKIESGYEFKLVFGAQFPILLRDIILDIKFKDEIKDATSGTISNAGGMALGGNFDLKINAGRKSITYQRVELYPGNEIMLTIISKTENEIIEIKGKPN